jgi:hypothetical protein
MGDGVTYAPWKHHQVLGTSRFHCGMDRDPNAVGTRRPGVLDDVL